MPKPAFLRSTALLVLLLASVTLSTTGSANAPATPERPAEFMVYQYPNTVFVIRVDLPQAEFGARVLGPDAALLRSAAVEGRRLGPIFLYIGSTDLARQLMIEVQPDRTVDRSQIALELIRFDAADRNSAALLQAYRMFSVGVETAHTEDSVTWASKMYSLRDAARQFARLGREELSLWADYFAAQLALRRLDDHELAVELAREARTAAERASLDSLVLAARVLESEGLLARLDAIAEASDADFEAAHRALTAAAGLAESLGFVSEQARALYRDGRVSERQGDDEAALERYRTALELLRGARDDELLDEVRKTAAAAYERQGRTSGALALLEGGYQAPDGAPDEPPDRAARLFDRGRLLNLAHRYPEAAEVLAEALSLQRRQDDPGTWGRTGLELAWALHSLGHDEEAREMLRESLARTPRQGNDYALIRAWGSLADILRVEGRHVEAAAARDTQRELIRAAGLREADALYRDALDARWRAGDESPAYRERLATARQAAAREGDRLTEARATAALCLAESTREGVTACSAEAEKALRRLRDSGVPRLAAEAAVSTARLMARSGRRDEAARAMQRALDEVQWFRTTLPGVLGAWYPAQADTVAAAFLDLVAPPGTSAERSLLALERLRRFEQATLPGAVSPALDPEREEVLRSLLARREAVPDGDRFETEAKRALLEARQTCAGCGTGAAPLDESGLVERLAALDSSRIVLAYALGGDRAWAVIAGARVRQRVELGPAEPIRDRLQGARSELAGGRPSAAASALEAAGQLLLGPLRDWLKPRIDLLSSGPLRAFPLDSLRLDGRYLAERSRVVHLGSLAPLRASAPRLAADEGLRVFLAGNPQSLRDPFRFELSVSREIDAVTERFVGPNLHVVQGVALGRDEFADPRFANAALLHLALPGVIDLARPERSRLLLSGTDRAGAGRSGLAPVDLRRSGTTAELVVLSGTAVSGDGAPLAAHLPLVSDLAAAGAAAVVFTSWPVGEDSAAAFARSFYRRLASDPDIESAFFAARSEGFPGNASPDFENWSGFQLFIR